MKNGYSVEKQSQQLLCSYFVAKRRLMDYWLKISIGIAVLLFVNIQISMGAEKRHNTTQTAALGNTGESVRAVPNNKTASLSFFYYGDSVYNTLGQETLKLKKTMDGYDFKVLLKHETLPSWIDLSEKDEKLADIKDIPTKAKLFKYLIQLAKDGYDIDLYIFSHGWTDQFKASKGSHGSEDFVTAEDIKNELHPSKTGLAQMPIRIVWGTNCYGQTLGDTWRSVGAKATAGARYVNFYPNSFGNFIDAWNKGISFDSAVENADTDAVRTVAQSFISLVDAPAKKKSGKWGGCSFGKTVLGDDLCAKDYFVSVWIDKDEWQVGKSGKENMNHSSFMVLGGDTKITKNIKQNECGGDSDCSSVEYCDKGILTIGKNQCVTKKADNVACDLMGGGHQCQSGKCNLSRCYTPNSVAMNGTCYVDDACKEGKCSSMDGAKGTCVCKEDSDCGAGKWCDGGLDLKTNACRAKLNKGQSCGKAGSLGNDHKCKSGQCSGFPKYVCK